MYNFDRPYWSASIAEFWSRWHISLSTWFRDYLYIPLGGSRVSPSRRQINISVVFLVSGLWHGANWTYVIWGALHSLYYLTELWTKRVREKIVVSLGLNRFPNGSRLLAISSTFVFVCLAWIPFRANSVQDLLIIVQNVVLGLGTWDSFSSADFGVSRFNLLVSFGLILVVELIHMLQGSWATVVDMLAPKPAIIRWAAYQMLLLAIILMGIWSNAQFIYFQF